MRLLVLEDEPELNRQITAILAGAGYRVDSARDGKEGHWLAAEYPFDAAIVDLGLPGMSGLEVIRALRSAGKTLPILVLTARSRWQDKVEGLEAGADDYLTKPFQSEELLARMMALLRRAAGSGQQVLRCGVIAIDFAAQQVLRDNVALELTTFEYRLLEFLIRQRERIVTKQELSDYLYPHDEDRDSNVLEVLIGRLRRKLDPDGTLGPIETARGRGYRFTLG